MADKNLLAQMLENLVNDDQAKAEELFHEYVVSASREIYENLIESEIADEEVDEAMDEEDEEDKVDEASKEDEDKDDEDLDENFEDIAYEGDDEMPGDATDDLEGDLDMGDEEDSEHSEKSEEELFMDLDSIVDELQAKFDELKGGDHSEPDADNMGGPSDHDADNEMEDFDLETVREYVEKVPAGHGAEKKGGPEGQLSGTGKDGNKPTMNTKSIVAGKNDMGGSAKNLNQSYEDSGAVLSAQGQLKGTGLSKGNVVPNPDAKGNLNVPGGKAGDAFKKNSAGHGAEKKGQSEGPMTGTGNQTNKEGGHNTQSLFRGRR
jgi:hypothetical protein